jgi:hypothetical protein
LGTVPDFVSLECAGDLGTVLDFVTSGKSLGSDLHGLLPVKTGYRLLMEE